MSDRVQLYDEFSEKYDVMVSWEDRLAREEPFFRELIDSTSAKRVLDVGCATGGHVFHFAKMGLEAIGVDPSAEMVRIARSGAAGEPLVGFIQAGFGELAEKVSGRFELLTCLGNTLPHALTPHDLDRALQDMKSMLKPGGVVVIQQLNYDRILAERQRFLGVSAGVRDDVEHIFFRFYDFDDPQLTFNIATFRKEAGRWHFRVDSTHLRPIRLLEMEDAIGRAGLELIATYGSFDKDPFDPKTSGDLIVVAKRL